MTTENAALKAEMLREVAAVLVSSIERKSMLDRATELERAASLTPAPAAPEGPRESDDFATKTARNKRVQARYDELMRKGKHGHYETLFRVVREEVERSGGERETAIKCVLCNDTGWHLVTANAAGDAREEPCPRCATPPTSPPTFDAEKFTTDFMREHHAAYKPCGLDIEMVQAAHAQGRAEGVGMPPLVENVLQAAAAYCHGLQQFEPLRKAVDEWASAQSGQQQKDGTAS